MKRRAVETLQEEKPVIEVCYHGDVPKLEKLPQGDWIDLRAAETVVMKQGDFALIPLGVSMRLPKGYEAHLVPRSSTFRRWGILQTNSCGIIDESYCGTEDTWSFPALAMRDTMIEKGDRICQFRIVPKMPPVELKTVEKLDDRARGGWGSTGAK